MFLLRYGVFRSSGTADAGIDAAVYSCDTAAGGDIHPMGGKHESVYTEES